MFRASLSLCENYDYYGSRRNGAYAEYVAGPANLLLKVPAGLDARAAAMVDPAAIALHAIWRTKLTAGSRVAVMGGGGPIGLFAVQWAPGCGSGATDIVAVDVSEEKAKLALEAGATTAVSSTEELEKIVGSGFDVVVETTGVPAVADQSVGIAARHGEVTLIGIPNAPVEISAGNWARLMRLEINICGRGTPRCALPGCRVDDHPRAHGQRQPAVGVHDHPRGAAREGSGDDSQHV